MALEQQQTVPVTLGKPSGESEAVQISFIAPETDIPSAGGAAAVVRATLSDGSTRALVLYAINPTNVSTMASNGSKRDAIALAIKAAAETL